jgi:hypothetical protein
MAKYWVYINDKVAGPYELDQLIRIQGFSRQTLVSVDDHSGQVGRWISPAQIPELARIFQKVDELHESTPAAPRPAAKPARPRMPAKLTVVPPPVPETVRWGWFWPAVFAALIAGGSFLWYRAAENRAGAKDRQTVRTLVESARLPSTSLYPTLLNYLQEKQIAPHWEIEQAPSGVYNAAVSWHPSDRSSSQLPVYAFEVNLQVQSVRGLNSAGIRLLTEGFPRPAAAKPAEAAKPKRSPGDLFPGALNDRRQAFEQGDFEAVWQSFSARRQAEMQQGGISQSGFVRMQKMTYAAAGVQQTILKTKPEGETSRLVLLRQAQPKHPDIYIKQRWIFENDAWRLDDEEKKVAEAAPAGDQNPAPSAEPAAAPENPAAEPAPQPPAAPAVPPNLPGLH